MSAAEAKGQVSSFLYKGYGYTGAYNLPTHPAVPTVAADAADQSAVAQAQPSPVLTGAGPSIRRPGGCFQQQRQVRRRAHEADEGVLGQDCH